MGIYKYNDKFKDQSKYFDALQKYLAYLLDDSQKKGNYSDPNWLAKEIAETKYMLACFYMNGVIVKKDEAKAFEILSDVYNKTNELDILLPEAAELLAYSYEKGIGTEANQLKAEEIRKAIMDKTLKCALDKDACRSCSDNFYDIFMRYSGYVPGEYPTDWWRANYWRSLSAEYFPKRNNLGGMYLLYSRRSPSRNWEKAVEYINKYTELFPNEAWGKYRKGYLHLFGKVLEKDEAKGIKLIREAAEGDDSYAQEYLSYLYDKGIGVEKSAEKSAHWFEKFKSNKETELSDYKEIAMRYVAGSDLITDYERSKFVLKAGIEAGNKDLQKDLDAFDAFAETILKDGVKYP